MEANLEAFGQSLIQGRNMSREIKQKNKSLEQYETIHIEVLEINQR